MPQTGTRTSTSGPQEVAKLFCCLDHNISSSLGCLHCAFQVWSWSPKIQPSNLAGPSISPKETLCFSWTSLHRPFEWIQTSLGSPFLIETSQLCWRSSEEKHRKNCECCPRHSLIRGHNVIVNIVVLNCQKCNQCLKCQVSYHKSLGLFFEGVLQLSLSLSFSLSLSLSFCWSGHVSSSLWSNVRRVSTLSECSLVMFLTMVP